ncbi:MAG: O-antigen ligase family protein, partial [Pseudomonadota bacterium]
MSVITRTDDRRLMLNITPQVRDTAAMSLWLFVTYAQFRFDELLLYPLALYFGYAFLRDWRLIEPLLRRTWFLFLYPLWTLTSLMWSPDLSGTVKSGLQVVLTVMICYVFAARARSQDLILAMFGISFFFALLLLDGHRVFYSKNLVGFAGVTLWVCALCLLIDERRALWLRGFAVVGLGLGFVIATSANSATAILLLLVTTAMIGVGRLIIYSGALLRTGSLALVFFGAAAFFTALMIGAEMVTGDPIVLVLEMLGKDATLTGRTLLWNYASYEIEQRPYLGTGAGGFWNYADSPTVRRIYVDLHKDPGDRFSFHNGHIEIAVHYGLIGLGFAWLTLAWATYQIVRWLLRIGGVDAIFFTAMAGFALAISFSESQLMRQFNQTSMLLIIGGLMAVRMFRERAEAAMAAAA